MLLIIDFLIVSFLLITLFIITRRTFRCPPEVISQITVTNRNYRTHLSHTSEKSIMACFSEMLRERLSGMTR
ncbi:hypothetical protein GZ607_000523 [Salmonella enterica subsp. enterica serovar Pomona]|uniref:Uncharacterized protein n=1 Tax=Citrobacter amalonaticus TaxID=35703 RepID=A0A8I0T280_CITAM|nr:hypothetical protein [Salmonella enterica]ECS7321364.1 hypothetical protein [Salmonella enterica subsp. enterica serovar Montevideo]EDX0879577.1 hypothetical protein [Salmonella enterica subsp. enterica]EEH6935995.1 hypothetical protein [Salmonella enterica subsp. enterica serovar Pomona]MBE0131489.1 hypothetical protein [Citrobacter amalonaticus]TCC76111.1 hypothetical protein EY919_09830 [Citrobacter braakii]